MAYRESGRGGASVRPRPLIARTISRAAITTSSAAKASSSVRWLTALATTTPIAGAERRQSADQQPVAQPHVAVAALAPDGDDRHRDDRQQRGRLGLDLGLVLEDRERGHEEDAAADAEQAADQAAEEAQHRRAAIIAHGITSSTAITSSSTAKMQRDRALGDALLQGGPGDGARERRDPDSAASAGSTLP